MKRKETIKGIWLEVSNIALNEGEEPEEKAAATGTPVATGSPADPNTPPATGTSTEAGTKAKPPKRTVSIDIQLKGDGDNDRWLTFNAGVDKFKPLMEAMKEKRPIHAKLGVKGNKLGITELRVSFAASPGRT